MSVGRLLSRHYLSKIGSGRVEINFYLLNPNNNRCWRATPVWIFDWDNIERAHVANQKPELRSPERIVFGQRKKTTAATTTKRRCLGAERNPGSCANPFCLWGDFWENVAIESVFLSVYRIPGRRWHFVKKFSDSWPPHLQNLRTVIDKQAYKHEVNFLFFVTHWKGFSLWKRRYSADLCDCRSCSTSMKPCIRQRSAWKAIQLSYYVSLGHCPPELKII